ncbi:MAG: hypothetical protein ACEPOZ_20045 [Marinifilaceae bacterium]
MSNKLMYLYGASVQGIQDFIFKTNKLKEIVGASELVERICTDQFKEVAGVKIAGNENVITTAAGNIKYLFDDEDKCRKLVRQFPKTIMEYAPGITISQAVVKVEENLSTNHLNELEQRLKAQRNKPVVDVQKGLLITERSRRTGLPAIQRDSFLDQATACKQDAVRKHYGKTNESSRGTLAQKFLSPKHFSDKENSKVLFEYESDKLTKDDDKSYIAVIHADGNNLGRIIQQLGKNLTKDSDPNYIKDAYRNFSLAIDEATKQAAQHAFYETFGKLLKKQTDNKKTTIPFRPIVLSGDDLTVLCEARYAVPFTKAFLDKFEETSKKQIQEKLIDQGFQLKIERLTACAGIAFIKNKYPFYYAVQLAEGLCSAAKKESKRTIENPENKDVPSSLAFYKVESSFHTSYGEIKERVLTTPTDINFCYGPYYTDSNKENPKISELENMVATIQQADAPAAQVRKWLNLVHKNGTEAENFMKRTIQVASDKTGKSIVEALKLETPIKSGKTHLYDVVSLASLTSKKEN